MTHSNERAREQKLGRLGTLSPDLISRVVPITMRNGRETRSFAWPATTLPRLRLVRRPESVLLVTDGLSDPWDPTLHQTPVPGLSLGFEAALEVPLHALDAPSDEAIAASWMPQVLWAATDWMVAERFDLKGTLCKFGVLTLATPPVVGLERLVASNGAMGVLAGLPFAGDVLESQVVLAPGVEDPRDPVWLLPLKLLTADEYAWAMGVPDASRARDLAERFLRGDRHWSWPERRSILR